MFETISWDGRVRAPHGAERSSRATADPSTCTAALIPIDRRLNKAPVPCRTDQDLIDADPRRQAGDKGDGAAEIFGLQHSGLLLFRWHHRPQLQDRGRDLRSEEHTSELQSPDHLVCRLLLEKKKKIRRCSFITRKHKKKSRQ